jgi:hypothetical protein
MVKVTVDWFRMVVTCGVPLTVLLGLGLYLGRRRRRDAPRQPFALRIALWGMAAMTLLGIGCGLLGAGLEEDIGEGTVIRLLHAGFVLDTAPTFGVAALQKALGIAEHPGSHRVFIVLAMLAVPATWFIVFFCVGSLLGGFTRLKR